MSDKPTAELVINSVAYLELSELQGEARDKMFADILRWWSKPEWVLDVTQQQLSTCGSLIRFVLEEFWAHSREGVKEEVLECERTGDWNFVATYVEKGGPIDDDEIRSAVARIIRAKKRRKTRMPAGKREKKRPRSIKTEYDGIRRAHWVRALMLLEPDSDLYVAHVGFGSVSRLSMTPIIASFAKPSAMKANAS